MCYHNTAGSATSDTAVLFVINKKKDTIGATEDTKKTETEKVQATSAEKPVITKQPLNVTVEEGEKAAFTVTAKGTDLSYQWEIDRNDGKGFVKLANATEHPVTHSLPPMQTITALNIGVLSVIPQETLLPIRRILALQKRRRNSQSHLPLNRRQVVARQS